MSANLVVWNLFSPLYSRPKLKWKDMPDCFVGNAITHDDITKWITQTQPQGIYLRSPKPFPVLISAQTGRGKNFFIMHNLREYTQNRILYVSNRNALDFQQKKEAAELTGTDFRIRDLELDRWEDAEEFGNITILTYQKLYRRLMGEDAEKWCRQFYFVILDECHFFYSDAFFNPYTGDILERIPKLFSYAVRIYMSATFDDVLEPIRYCEHNATSEDFFDNTPFAYRFPRDYSRYTTYYFSKEQQIIDQIIQDSSREKWLVFVSSKRKGIAMCNALNDRQVDLYEEAPDVYEADLTQDRAIYLDADSRRSDNPETRIAWENLRAKGSFPGKVLITTSVLDNGFSIKDDKIKSVVLFTNDKTEFLQELGRCRLDIGQTLNVYIKKLGKSSLTRLKQEFREKNRIVMSYCGNKDSTVQDPLAKEGEPAKTIQQLWTVEANSCRGFIHLVANGKNQLYSKFNFMARWRIKLLGDQLQKYEALFKKNEGMAPIWCKEDWLGGEGGTEDTRYAKERDLDIDSFQLALEKLEAFLDEQATSGSELIEGEENFTEFSKQFVKLYLAAYKGDKSFNSSRVSEKGVGVQSINNHLQKLFGDGIRFELVQIKGARKNAWVLQRS